MNQNKYLSSAVRSCFQERSFSFHPLEKPVYPSTPGIIQSENLRLFGKDRGQPFPPFPSFRQFRRFFEDGDRSQYEGLYFQRRRSLTAAALRCWADPEDRESLTELEDILWSVCQEYTWALPAHLVQGGMAYQEAHEKQLDLFNCETAFALSEIRFLMGDRLNRVLSEEMRRQVFRRVLDPYLNAPFGTWKWETLENNWSAVCASSIGSSALYLLSDEELKMVLQKLMPSLEYYLKGFGKMGLSLEGLGYWTYGWYFFVSFADLLFQKTGGRIDLLDFPLCRVIAEFQQKCYLTESLSVSFSDSSSHERYRSGLTRYLAERYPTVEIPPESLRSREEDHCGRWATAFRDILWSSDSPGDSGLRENQTFLKGLPVCFPEAQWMISPAGKGDLAFAAKGGHNGEPHNQNDLGSFILASGETEFLCDPGAGLYTAQYFGEGQYKILCKSSLGHSVPIPGGLAQKAGEEYHSLLVEEIRGDQEILFTVDLTRAYPEGSFQKLIRSFSFQGNSKKMVLTDRFSSTCSLQERFVSFIRPREDSLGVILEGGDQRVTGERYSLRIKRISEGPGPVIGSQSFLDHRGKEKTLWTMDYPCPAEKEGLFILQFQLEE